MFGYQNKETVDWKDYKVKSSIVVLALTFIIMPMMHMIQEIVTLIFIYIYVFI